MARGSGMSKDAGGILWGLRGFLGWSWFVGELKEISAIVRKTVATRCENSSKEQRMLFKFH